MACSDSAQNQGYGLLSKNFHSFLLTALSYVEILTNTKGICTRELFYFISRKKYIQKRKKSNEGRISFPLATCCLSQWMNVLQNAQLKKSWRESWKKPYQMADGHSPVLTFCLLHLLRFTPSSFFLICKKNNYLWLLNNFIVCNDSQWLYWRKKTKDESMTSKLRGLRRKWEAES